MVGRKGCYPAGNVRMERWVGLAVITRACWLLAKKLGGILIPDNTNPRYELKTQILEWEPDMDSTKVNSLRRSPLGLKEKKGGRTPLMTTFMGYYFDEWRNGKIIPWHSGKHTGH